MKICTKCGKTKELTEYYTREHKNRKGIYTGRITLSAACKACHANNARGRYIKNKQSYTKCIRDRRLLLGEISDYIKSYNGCSICEEKDPVVLEYHHVNGKADKVNRVCYYIQSASREAMLREAAKCAVLCSNCHKRVTRKVTPGPIKKCRIDASEIERITREYEEKTGYSERKRRKPYTKRAYAISGRDGRSGRYSRCLTQGYVLGV